MRKTIREIGRRAVPLLLALTVAVADIQVPAEAKQAEATEMTETTETSEATESAGTTEADEKQGYALDGKAEPVVVMELKDERTENSNTYLLSNGLKKTEYYSEKIRFENEDGELTEYNPKLVKVKDESEEKIAESAEITKKEAAKYAYENKSGDLKHYFPQKLDNDTPMLLTNEEYKVSFSPLEISVGEVCIKTEEISSDEKNTIAEYENEDAGMTLSYESLKEGVKEEIILDLVPESNIFSFEMTLENMTAKVNSDGRGITFIDEKEDIITGGIAAPFMNDATGEAYSEALAYTLVEKASDSENIYKYILKITVDEEYLKSSDRVYPVTIDPSVTWTGRTNVQDVIVTSYSPDTNYYDLSVATMTAGKVQTGIARSYIKLPSLSSIIEGKYVESARLILYESGSSSKDVLAEVRPVSQSFECSSITWNTKAAYTSEILSTLQGTGTDKAKLTANVTAWARAVAN